MHRLASSHSARTFPSLGLVVASASLIAAVSWLVFRTFVGLDFTDELQYYGEISGLVRTGRFFHEDLFIQQLGYFFLLPWFKLHAALFPDQSYLLLSGRLILLLLYAGVGAMFWRSSAPSTRFPLAQRIAGLAAFLSCIPFQVLAPSYNTLAYLLVVALLSLWLRHQDRPSAHDPWLFAALLAVLAATYPPAGVAGVFLAVFEITRRRGVSAASVWLTLFVGTCLLIAAGMFALHGADFFAELGVSLKFSRAFGVGGAIGQREQLVKLGAVLFGGGIFACQFRRSHAVQPKGPTLGKNIVSFGLLLGLLGYQLAGGSGSDLAIALFFGLLLLLALDARQQFSAQTSGFMWVGLILGGVFSITSSNGIRNFGLGIATVVPFLLLATNASRPKEQGVPAGGNIQLLTAIALVILSLVDGIRHPYRESYQPSELRRVTDIPAFKGIWTTRLKTEALAFFSTLAPLESLRGKRVTVLGPHPAFYFVCGGEPATRMFFMHYSGAPAVHSLLAEKLFRDGKVDAVLITNVMPDPVRDKVEVWTHEGCFERRIALPDQFNRAYRRLTGYDFLPEIVLLTRDRFP